MKQIIDSRLNKINEKWVAECTNCNKQICYSFKDSALKMLNRGSCRNCKKDYRNVIGEIPVYKNLEGKWCKTCSGCGKEQAYTRKDHAKQSYLADSQCKNCVSQSKGFSNNRPVGDKLRLFNRFSKLAKSRNIEWNLSLEEMFSSYNEKCSLTGWDIDISYLNCNASLDRIDNDKGYSLDNIQWVHTMVNMCKNKYKEEDFIKMCEDIANKKQQIKI
jgi:hypothetical protein